MGNRNNATDEAPNVVKETRSRSGARILFADNYVVHSPEAVAHIARDCGRIALDEYRRNKGSLAIAGTS